MSAAEKVAYFFVIGFFALLGVIQLLGGVGMLLDLRVPGETSPGRQIQIADGFEGLGFGIAYITAAIGLSKFYSIARFLAVILLLWDLFGAMSNLSSVYGLTLLIATIGVSAWLLSPQVRARFAEAKTGAKTS